jgi:hypothetical protein
MSPHSCRGRQCAFESLEDRWLLAGNVTAQIVKGNLVIKGDSSDNQITITAAAVTGVGTTVNGVAAFTIPSTFAGGIKMNLKGGNDTATLSGPLTLTGLQSKNTEIVTNTGTLTVNGKMEIEDVSTLTLVTTTVNGNMEAEGTKGSDTFLLTDLKVTGKAEIETGKGTDTVTITGTTAGGATFGKLAVELGKDNDSLTINNTTVTKKTKLDGGRGVDTLVQSGTNSLAGLKIKHFES